MSTQTNNAYMEKSMNGIISIDDGAGGVMEGGIITANELSIDNLQSKSPPNVVSLFTNTTTTINMGSPTSIVNVSNLNVKTINMSTLNVSDINSSFANITFINTRYIEPSATEITNDAFLYTTTTEGVVSIATGITNGAINVGNELSTGSLSISKGTININPKSLFNVANLLTTGTANMFNASTFTGTVNFANTSNLSGTRNNIKFGSLTSNISMVGQIDIGTTDYNVNISGRDVRINSGSNRPIVIGSLQSSNNTIIGGYAAAGLALGTSISTGNIEMGTYLTTGYIEIGSPSSNSFVDIYSRTGRIGIGDFNQFNGTVNIAATANVSNASTNTINIGSATTSSLILGSNTMAGNMFLRTAGNLNLGTQSNQIQMGTSQAATNTISIGTTGASTLNLNCPITPNYNASYNVTNGAGINSNVGYIYNNSTSPASFSLATNDAFYNCQQITLVDTGVYMIWIDNKLYNNNTTGSIVLYYMEVMVGTTLGGTNIFDGFFNSYAQLFNATTPNSQIDSPFTLPYVNTTANQILYTRIRVGRSALGLYWDNNSYIRAVRIA